MKGLTTAGFTPKQAEFLSVLFNIMQNLVKAHSLRALEEVAILYTVLESKRVIAPEEIEAERTQHEERVSTLLDLESMVDPELKKSLEEIENYLRHRAPEEETGGQPET